jgi:hypothetical protein
VRVVIDALAGVGDADELEHLDRALAGLSLGDLVVDPVGLDDLRADGVVGVQRRERVLKIMDIFEPRKRRTSSSLALTSSWPSSQISPEMRARVPLCSPRTAWLVTDLPEPDSPTMPIVWPRSTVKLNPSTDFTRPSSVGKCTRRSRMSR